MKTWQVDSSNDHPDLTPMIDVVFLLIVFFMTVATLLQAERVEIDMAIADRSRVPEDAGRRETVTITREGTIHAGIRQIEVLDDLAAIIRGGVETVPGYKVNLRVDRDASHRHVREVMEVCAENGAFDIVFSVYQR